MRKLIIFGLTMALMACAPAANPDTAAKKEAEMSAEEIDAASHEMGPPFVVEVSASEATLTSPYAPNAPAFFISCAKGAKTLTASADINQLGQYAKAGPGQFIASGAPFNGTVTLPPTDAAETVQISVPLDAKVLAAIAGATTTRIAIGDGFAESQVDSADNFEKFAAGCAGLQGITLPAMPTPQPAKK